MKKLFFGLLLLGLTTPLIAQVDKPEDLPEVVVRATNYKYLNSVSPEEVASVPVKILEEKVAAFDVHDSGFYQDEYGVYVVTFFIPEGKILAAYDKEGKILRTIERFKDVQLPVHVQKAVGKRFPGWGLTNDAYIVNYHEAWGATKKFYKIKITNGDQVLRIKVNDNGDFL